MLKRNDRGGKNLERKNIIYIGIFIMLVIVASIAVYLTFFRNTYVGPGSGVGDWPNYEYKCGTDRVTVHYTDNIGYENAMGTATMLEGDPRLSSEEYDILAWAFGTDSLEVWLHKEDNTVIMYIKTGFDSIGEIDSTNEAEYSRFIGDNGWLREYVFGENLEVSLLNPEGYIIRNINV